MHSLGNRKMYSKRKVAEKDRRKPLDVTSRDKVSRTTQKVEGKKASSLTLFKKNSKKKRDFFFQN